MGKSIKAIFGGSAAFATPKPTRLLERILQIATNPGDLVLDSFAGSGTTGHAVLKLNHAMPNNEPRRFILIEMEERIARDVTAERVRRVAGGYTTANGERVEGLGGSFRFCKLEEPLFDEAGQIRSQVLFADLAAHLFFAETGEPIPKRATGTSPLIGISNGIAYILLFNGVLGDKRPAGGNVLTAAVLDSLPPHNGPRVVYGESCRLGEARLRREGITFKQVPYEIKVR